MVEPCVNSLVQKLPWNVDSRPPICNNQLEIMVRMVMVVITMMKMVKMMMVVMVTLITIVWYAICIVYKILIPGIDRHLTRWIITWRCTIGCSWLPYLLHWLFFFWCYVNKYEKEHSRAICDIGWCIALLGPFIYRGGIKCKQYIYISRLK